MSDALPPRGSRFLLVDDDDRLRDRMARALRDRGYQVDVADGPQAALACFDAAPADYALVDLRMPGGSGLDLCADLRARDPQVQIVVLTGYGSIPTAVEAVKRGASNYLQKPADAEMVLAAFAQGELESQRGGDAEEYHAPSLARTEWEHIQRVLDDCDGNISRAARVLGLHRRTLQRKLQKFPPRE